MPDGGCCGNGLSNRLFSRLGIVLFQDHTKRARNHGTANRKSKAGHQSFLLLSNNPPNLKGDFSNHSPLIVSGIFRKAPRNEYIAACQPPFDSFKNFIDLFVLINLYALDAVALQILNPATNDELFRSQTALFRQRPNPSSAGVQSRSARVHPLSNTSRMLANK